MIARSGAPWIPAIAIGGIAERVASLDHARGILHALARSLGSADARVARRASSVFSDYARDAAEAFGDRDAADEVCIVLDALIDGIKILDDIQDEEPVCLAREIGEERALVAARAALAYALDLGVVLPFEGDAWRAAIASVGRAIRETAAGQQLELSATPDFESYWNVVDRKTPPLVATALELGALAAGATPAQAFALTRLAVPLGRLLQIADDCNDALGEAASDWRTPHLNLLMLFSLCGPNGAELRNLLRAETMQEAQLWLLRDGALSYAIHAQKVTLNACVATLDSLALPDPSPFRRTMDRQREESEALLAKMA